MPCPGLCIYPSTVWFAVCAGVLKFKRMGEEELEKSGIPYTLIRPNRLTDGEQQFGEEPGRAGTGRMRRGGEGAAGQGFMTWRRVSRLLNWPLEPKALLCHTTGIASWESSPLLQLAPCPVSLVCIS